MDAGPLGLRASIEKFLWPLVEALFASHDLAGLAVSVVREEEVVSRGFGVRDTGLGSPVTPETMFHLASVSKPFVATAIVSLATARDAGAPVIDLDAPISAWVPEFTLADGRADEVTARGLLSHSSGLPDVSEYGWHDPQLGDDALSVFARSLSGWRLKGQPGSTFSYSNAGYELLGLLLSRATGTTFEEAIRQQVLAPLRMQDSTFLRSEVPARLAASPHVGMPLSVPEGAYPYTPAPCSQFEPAFQPGRDVSLDGRPFRSRRGGLSRFRRAVGAARPQPDRPDVGAGGAGGRTSVGRSHGARLGRG